jgi:hypothetical protein
MLEGEVDLRARLALQLRANELLATAQLFSTVLLSQRQFPHLRKDYFYVSQTHEVTHD